MLIFLLSCLLDGKQLGGLIDGSDLGTYSERAVFPAACTELEGNAFEPRARKHHTRRKRKRAQLSQAVSR